MKINFDSDDNLPLNKTIGIPVVAIVVRVVFHENNILSTTFLRWMLVWNIKMLYYDRIDVSEGTDVNKTSASKEGDFCH